jgi:hypothetical protein
MNIVYRFLSELRSIAEACHVLCAEKQVSGWDGNSGTPISILRCVTILVVASAFSLSK